MAGDDAQKALQTLPPALYDFFRKAVGEHLAREGRDVDASRFVFKDVAKGLKVRIAATDERVPEFKGGDVGLIEVSIRCLSNEDEDEAENGAPCRLFHSLCTFSSQNLEKGKVANPSVSTLFFPPEAAMIQTHHASAGSSLRFQESSQGCCTFPQSVMVLFMLKVRGNVGAWVRDSRSAHAL